jgi:hypothetical protein
MGSPARETTPLADPMQIDGSSRRNSPGGSPKDHEKLKCKVCLDDLLPESIMCEKCGHGCCAPCAKEYIIHNPRMKCPGEKCDQHWDLGSVLQLPLEHILPTRLPIIEDLLVQEEKEIWPDMMPFYHQLLHEVELLKKTEIGSQENKEVNIRIRALKYKLLGVAPNEGEAVATMEAVSNHAPRKVIKCPADGCSSVIGPDGVCMRTSDPKCGTRVCIRCREVLTDETVSTHQCKKEDVESAEEIARSSVNCPKCHVPIYRYEGCFEMFCTMCHVSFDWKTGKIIKGSHNYHLQEFLRTQGGNGPLPVHDCEAPITSDVVQPRLRNMPEDFTNRVQKVMTKFLEWRDIAEPTPLNQILSRMRMALWLSGFMFPRDYQKALFQNRIIALHKMHDRDTRAMVAPTIEAHLHHIVRLIDEQVAANTVNGTLREGFTKTVTPEMTEHLVSMEGAEAFSVKAITTFEKKMRCYQDLTNIEYCCIGLPKELLEVEIPME